MKKVALVIPYIGNFRQDFPVFLRSCLYNTTIDFLFFVDNPSIFKEFFNVKNGGVMLRYLKHL